MDLLDPYIAEKVVTRKHADLRAEATESALRSAVAAESGVAVHRQLIRAIRLACSLILSSATLAWRGSIKSATALGKADQ